LDRWGEELERDAVRVAEAHARAVAGVLDLAVGDAQLVQPTRPLLQLRPVGDVGERRKAGNGSSLVGTGRCG
jgi:hypothetical protein